GVLAANQVAQAAKEQRAEGADGKAGGKAQQGEEEKRSRGDAREEVGGDIHGKRAGEVEIVPFEDSADRRRENDLAVLTRHRTVRAISGGCHCHVLVLLSVSPRDAFRGRLFLALIHYTSTENRTMMGTSYFSRR